VSLLDLVDRVVAQARPGEGVEAYGVDQTDTSVRAHGGEVESLSSGRTRGVGVRVIVDHRVGYAHTADVSEGALAETLEAARRNATVGEPDEGNVLPSPPEPVSGGPLDGPLDDLPALYDEAFDAFAPERKVELALALEAAARGYDPRVKGIDSATYGDAVSMVAIASTAGVRGTYRRCDAYVTVEVLAEADGATTSAYGLDLRRVPQNLDVEAAAAEGAQRALRLLGGRKPATARLPVLLDPFATAAFLGVLAGPLNAESVQKGRSLFEGKVGERVAGEHVTLVDDGRRADAPAAAPWDDEGVPTGRTPLIEAGLLTGYLHNTATAVRAGAASTGNAGRAGYKSLPGVQPTNLYLEPGSAAQDALLARAGNGFYCQQILGVHSGANPITGEFSVGAAGLMVRDGELAEPVREATIASTIPELLAGLVAVGADLRFLPFGGGMGGATLLFDGMALSGA
jgi:PmbA protein